MFTLNECGNVPSGIIDDINAIRSYSESKSIVIERNPLVDTLKSLLPEIDIILDYQEKSYTLKNKILTLRLDESDPIRHEEKKRYSEEYLECSSNLRTKTCDVINVLTEILKALSTTPNSSFTKALREALVFISSQLQLLLVDKNPESATKAKQALGELIADVEEITKLSSDIVRKR